MSFWKRRKNKVERKRPQFIEEVIVEGNKKTAPPTLPYLNSAPIDIFDPTLIVNQLLEGLRCQGISAAYFCDIIGLHKNTISRWKTGERLCPDSYAFLFRRLVLDIEAGVDMKALFDIIRPPEIRENINL